MARGKRRTTDDAEELLSVEWKGASLKEIREAAAARAEKAYLGRVLREHQGRLSEVARQARIGTRSLYDKMRRHGLKKEDYRAGS